MAEYIDRQTAIDAIKNWDQQKLYLPIEFRETLEGMPPVDVRPVVLCGKCRWFDDTGYINRYTGLPQLRIGHCRVLGRDVQACWYCGTGEQKGGDAE